MSHIIIAESLFEYFEEVQLGFLKNNVDVPSVLQQNNS